MTEALGLLEAGTLAFDEQPDDGVTYAEKIDATERRVDPGGSAATEARRVRALTPHIGAFVMLAGEARLGVRDVAPLGDGPGSGTFAPGDAESTLLLGLADGALSIETVQPAGKRWMSAADYLRGYGVPAAASGTA